MAQGLIWSNEALDDVDRIAGYISKDSPAHARIVVERLFELADEDIRVLAVIHGKQLLESAERFERQARDPPPHRPTPEQDFPRPRG